MLRKILLIGLPLVLPTLAYVAWSYAERRRLAAGAAGPPAWWSSARWPWLASAGVGLMAVVLVALSLFGGEPIRGDYAPARFEDGRIIRGTVAPPER